MVTSASKGLEHDDLLLAAKPLVPTFTRTQPKIAEDTALDAPKISSAALPVSKTDKESNNFNVLMMMSMFASQNADEDGTISAGSLTGFIDVLEQAGIDVSPIKTAIEKATGKTYEEFKAESMAADTAGSSLRFDVSGFYRQDRDTGARLPYISNSGFDSLKALRVAASDNAGAGYCARGTANILESMGYGVTRGNATTWDDTLPKNGWVRLKGVTAANAPEGAVLVYNSDIEEGRRARNNGGGKYGHVEIVAETAQGGRVYVSDKARSNAGGSVPENFEGAYLYVGKNAPASNLAIAQQLNGGIKMAASHSGPAAPAPV